MKIVIEIPDHVYEHAKNISEDSNDEWDAMRAIAKGFLYEERPHGEWAHWGSPFADDTIANSIVCSICKARYVEIEGEVFNFCPNCGADMRKSGEEK